MYLYYDRYGTLKEQIVFNTARVGNSGINKIFVYWESVEDFADWEQELALQARYLLQDNTQYPSATTFQFSAIPVTAELPFDNKQDLKYFSYGKEYKFLTIDIPDNILSFSGAVKSYIWVLNSQQKRILGLGAFAFMVDGNIGEVKQDETITIAQWNMIAAQLGLLSGSVIDVTCDIATNTLKVYYANGTYAVRNLPPNNVQTTVSTDFMKEFFFFENSWEQDGEQGYYLALSSLQVGFTDNKFFVQLEEKGEYNSKQGGFVLSDNIFKGNDGSVLLYSAKPFDGRLLLVGGKLLSGDSLVTGLSYNPENSQLSYKTADGITHTIYLGIDQKFDKSNITQTIGDSTVKVMSQKAVTDNISEIKSDLDAISYTKKATNHINLEDESNVNPSTLVREYDGENVNLSFTEVVNPTICWWLNNLISGKEYTLSFEVTNGKINENSNATQIRTWSNTGTGAAFLVGFVKNNNMYSATFIAPDLSETRPAIFQLQLVYNSKNVSLANVKCVETGEVDKNYIKNDSIIGLEESNLSESLQNKINNVSSYNPIMVSVFSKSAITGLSGECVLAKFPNGKTMLMDTHLSGYSNDVISFLRNHNVSKIDYLMITHYHSDHVGGILKWIEDGKIANGKIDGDITIEGATVFIPPEITEAIIEKTALTGENVSELVSRQNTIKSTLVSNGCNLVVPTDDYTVNIGNAMIEFWNTDHNPYSSVDGTHLTTNYNDFSICCNILYGSQTFSNTADIGPIGQSVVGGSLKKTTIMMSPHHGWDNGVNNLKPEFINNIAPDIVISSNGSEHHTNSQLAANIMNASSPMQTWCEKNNIRNYCTCFNGEINLMMYPMNWCFEYTDYSGEGRKISYSHYIRNNKNWKYSDNSDCVEN